METAFGRLVGRRILDHDADGFFSQSSRVSRTERYPLVDGSRGEEIRRRVLRTLFGEALPDPRDVAIIGPVHCCGGFEAMLEPEEFETVRERIGLFSGMDLIGRTIMEAVRSSYRPPESMRAVRRRALPRIGILDFVRSPTLRAGNVPRFFAELYAHIHATHSPTQREGRRRDLVDDLMALHQADPPVPAGDRLGFAFIAPIIAGHYTGSATAFAIYERLANPGAMRLVSEEADALFADGDPAAGDLDMDAIGATHRVVMETLRLHPVVPVHNRTALNSFEIDGM